MVLGIPANEGALYREIAVELLELGDFSGGPHLTVQRAMKAIPGLESKAKAVLWMGGPSVGAQMGASAVGGLGLVWVGDIQTHLRDLKLPLPTPEITMRSSSTSRETQIIIPNGILFDFDKDTLGSKRYPGQAFIELSKVVNLVRPGTSIVIYGHTDYIGKDKYNKDLSQRRANRVRDFFISKEVKLGNFKVVKGLGESKPVANNRTIAGRANNRRVEITLM